MNAGLYVSVSTTDQVERYGLPAQRQFLVEHAERQGWTYEIFEDAGISGETVDARPAMLRLLDAARHRRIQVALAVEMERFSRSESLFDWLLIKQAFREGGVRFGTPAQLYDSADTEDDFLTDLFGALAKREKRKIITRTRRGKIEAARRGRWQGNFVPYGYRRIGRGQVVVCEPEAEVVRRIFAWLLEGRSANRIAGLLQAAGIRPRRAASWCRSVVAGILDNPVYVGRGIHNSRDWSGVKRGDGPPRRRPESEWVVVPMPRIVSDETWERARTQLRRNAARSPRRLKWTYLLRSLVRCDYCGWAMVGTSANRHRRYRCAKLYRGGAEPACPVRSVAAEPLEALVWAQVVALVRKPTAILEAIRRSQEGRVTEREEFQMRLAAIQAALAAIPAERERVQTLYREGYATLEETTSQLLQTDRKRSRLLDEKDTLERRLSVRAVDSEEAKHLERLVARVQKRLDHLTPEERAEVIQGFVRAVIVAPGGKVSIQARVPMRAVATEARPKYGDASWQVAGQVP
jgi:site-specific DNA recombinase